eukprot:991498-Alexandrium_andersonii.AAC.1
MRGPAKPLHVFGDICSRLQPADRERLQHIENEYLNKAKKHGGMIHALTARYMDKVGQDMVKQMLEVLRKAKFKRTRCCYACNRE